MCGAEGDALIRGMDAGLTQRLDTLWRMESPALIARLARMLGGDIGRAEELAQDTWLAALERYAQQMPRSGQPAPLSLLQPQGF